MWTINCNSSNTYIGWAKCHFIILNIYYTQNYEIYKVLVKCKWKKNTGSLHLKINIIEISSYIMHHNRTLCCTFSIKFLTLFGELLWISSFLLCFNSRRMFEILKTLYFKYPQWKFLEDLYPMIEVARECHQSEKLINLEMLS